MDFENDISVGEFIIIECYRKLDPETYTDIYDDIYLKDMQLHSSKDSGVQIFQNSMVFRCWVVSL